MPVCANLGPGAAAALVLVRYWDRLLPVDPVKIATAMGIAVYGRGEGADAHYPYLGAYRVYDGKPALEYAVTARSVVQRFMVAHTLAHAIFDRDERMPGEVADVHSSTYQKERRANEFAWALLMPETVVREYIQTGKAGDLDALAAVFGVSRDAMGYRLLALGCC